MSEEDWTNITRETIENMSTRDVLHFLIDHGKQLGFLPREVRDSLFSKIVDFKRPPDMDSALRHISDVPSKIKKEARRKIATFLVERGLSHLSVHQRSILTKIEFFTACSKKTRKKIIQTLLSYLKYTKLALLLETLPENKGLLTKEMFEMLLPGDVPVESVFEMTFQLISRKDCPLIIRRQGVDKIINAPEKHTYPGQKFGWIHRLLTHKNLLSDEARRKQIEKILSQKVLYRTYLILCLPDLPLDLKESALSFLHKKTIKEIKSPWLRRFLNKILQKKWFLLTDDIANGVHGIDDSLLPADRFLYRLDDDNIIVFNDIEWSVTDIEKKTLNGKRMISGVLLSGHFAGGAPLVKVILLRDPSNLRVYAYRVDPDAGTVKEAIAYAFQLDPEKFKGFTVEK